MALRDRERSGVNAALHGRFSVHPAGEGFTHVAKDSGGRGAEVWFHLSANLRLYHFARQGDLQRIQNDLGFLILCQTRMYERQFGSESGAAGFAGRFAEARSIARKVESTLVPLDSPSDLPLSTSA